MLICLAFFFFPKPSIECFIYTITKSTKMNSAQLFFLCGKLHLYTLSQTGLSTCPKAKSTLIHTLSNLLKLLNYTRTLNQDKFPSPCPWKKQKIYEETCS